MIESRPQQLLSDPTYNTLLPPPYKLDLSPVPELVKLSLLTLGGVQPITGEMSQAAGGLLSDTPTPGEVELFRNKGARFQLIFIVLNCVVTGVQEGVPTLAPFAISLIPSSKRGEVTSSEIDFVASVAGTEPLGGDTAYVGLDPFRGDWRMWGNVEVVVGAKPRSGFMDELGLVYDHYFLATDHDPSDIAMFLPGLPEAVRQRYFRHRAKLLFTPFRRLEGRRVWGVETPIELFVFQELARRGIPLPQPQVMFFEDGSSFPSLYDSWNYFGADKGAGLVTEADFYFADQKVAVFCDGSHHIRRPQRMRDAAIDAKLTTFGVKSVRLPARQIMNDLVQSVDQVTASLE